MTGGKMIPDYFFIELLSKKHLFLGKPQSKNIRHATDTKDENFHYLALLDIMYRYRDIHFIMHF